MTTSLRLCALGITLGLTPIIALSQEGARQATHIEQGQSLRGRITNTRGEAIELATIALLSPDGQIIDGAVSASDGTFTLIKGLAYAHSLRIQMLGYETKTIELSRGQLQVGDIVLPDASKSLGAVEVQARRKAINLMGSQLTAQISATPLGQLPTMIHVLGSLPFVKATPEGVEVQGRGKAIIYYGHRPITQEELLRLNPGEVKDIEVLLVPDASYPAGTPAVIRIIPKSVLASRMGVYLRGDLTTQKYVGYNALGQFYWDSPKLSFKVGLNSNTAVSYTSKSNKLQTTDEMPATISRLEQEMRNKISNYSLFSDAVYRFNPQHEIGVQYTLFRMYKMEVDLDVDAEFRLSDGTAKVYSSDLEGRLNRPLMVHATNAYYHGQIAKLWTIHAEMGYYQQKEDMMLSTDIRYSKPQNQTDWNKNSSNKDIHNLAWRAYIERKLPKGKLQIGHDGSYSSLEQGYQQLNTAYQSLLPDNTTSNKQLNLNIFATWSQAWSTHFSTQVGLRLEGQNARVESNKMLLYEDKPLYLFPSLSLSYRKGNFSSSLSYENVLRNHHYRQLSTHTTYIDELLLESGNPHLRPLVENKLTLINGYKDLSLTAVYAHRKNEAVIFSKRHHRDPKRIIYSRSNIEFSYYRLSLAYSPTIGLWRPTWTAQFAQQNLEYLGQRLNDPLLSLSFKNMISLKGAWLIQAELNALIGGHDGVSRKGNYCSLDLGLIKHFGSRLSMNLNINNLLRLAKKENSFSAITIDEQLEYNKYLRINLGLSYQFNAKQNKYRGGEAGAAERSRF